MSFQCPKCSAASLEIVDTIQFPADSQFDEILLQVTECGPCGFRGLAIFEEARRGNLADESWVHTGFRVSGDELAVVRQAIRNCPDPCNPLCTCSTHLILGRRSYGRWVQLRGFDVLADFPMEQTR